MEVLGKERGMALIQWNGSSKLRHKISVGLRYSLSGTRGEWVRGIRARGCGAPKGGECISHGKRSVCRGFPPLNAIGKKEKVMVCWVLTEIIK